MTLNEWAKICLEIYKPNQKEGTHYYISYRNRLKNCVLVFIGDMELEEIKPIDCQRCINMQSGNSAYQISQTKQMMNFLFEHAIGNELITRNPAKNIVKPKGTKTSRRSLSHEEREAFLNAINKVDYLPFAFMYYCGLRPSEARSIRESDIIEINGCQALHVRGTKTKNAVRDVPIPNKLLTLIQNSLKSANKTADGYVCNITEDTFKGLWRKLKKSDPALSSKDLVPYCLRHTFCTDLMKKGVDIRVAQKLMGHSTIDLTSTIYSHLDEDLFTITYKMLC